VHGFAIGSGCSQVGEHAGEPLDENFDGGCRGKPSRGASFQTASGTARWTAATLGRCNRWEGKIQICSWLRLLAEGNTSAPSPWLAQHPPLTYARLLTSARWNIAGW